MILLALALLLAPDPTVVEAARAAWHTGHAAEQAGDADAATAAYRRSLDLDPGGRFAARAHARLRVLAAIPAEDRGVLTRFDGVRRDYRRLGSAAATAQVTALLAQARHPQTIAQLRLWLGEEAAGAGDLATARAHAYAAAETPNLPVARARRAFELAVRATEPGDWPEVERRLAAFAQRWPDRAAAVDVGRLIDEMADRRQRRVARIAAWLSLLSLLALLVWHRAWRALRPTTLRRWRPWRTLAYLAWAFGGAGMLAERFEGGYGWVVGAVALAVGPVSLAAGALGQVPRRAPAWLVGAVVAAATLGAAFLLLARLGQAALMGM